MKVLLSAYACHPAVGSEPGVGFETLLAVAAEHEVWVLTRQKNAEDLSESLAAHPYFTRIHLVGLDLSRGKLAMKKKLGPVGLQIYYDRWQREASEVGAKLHREVHFDVAHHITFSADWSRAGIALVDAPFVWGPIGGGVQTPRSLLPSLGWRGVGAEVGRRMGRWLLRRRRWYRRAWRTARVVLVQNHETVKLGPEGMIGQVLPNSTALSPPRLQAGNHRTNEVVVVGRLIPWKGGLLALEAFSRLDHQDSSLIFIGEGPEQARLAAAARRLGIERKVRFEGSLPRAEVLERVARAGVFLHMAVHEENSMAVGEALSLGTPVVCLDWGGPAELIRQWPMSPGRAVPVKKARETTMGAAKAIDEFLRNPPPIPPEPLLPRIRYAPSLMEAYERAIST